MLYIEGKCKFTVFGKIGGRYGNQPIMAIKSTTAPAIILFGKD